MSTLKKKPSVDEVLAALEIIKEYIQSDRRLLEDRRGSDFSPW